MNTDTLEYSRTLRAGGFSQEQADSVVRVMSESQRKSDETLHKTLVTKQDFAEFKSEIKLEFANFETRMAERDARSSWRMVGAIIAVTAIFGFIIKVL